MEKIYLVERSITRNGLIYNGKPVTYSNVSKMIEGELADAVNNGANVLHVIIRELPEERS